MTFLDTKDLAERWKCSTRKIEQQRLTGNGPTYVKIGNRVLYDLEVVRVYEADNTFVSTSEESEHAVSRIPQRKDTAK